jgi:signal transduction histidine kinase/ligand-binding sensor domain-containing protein
LLRYSRRYRFERVACFLLIALTPASVFAQTTDRTIGQFVHTAWTAKDGVPANIWDIAQTTDGFLWLGTPQGLYRFDGVTFEHYHPESGPDFPYRGVSALRALSNGDLWIGFRGMGVASLLRNGKCTNYSPSDGLPAGLVSVFVQGRDGVIWVGTDKGLARLEDGRWRAVGHDWGYSPGMVQTMYVDRNGTLWLASRDSIIFLPLGAKAFQPTGIKVVDVPQFAESHGGTLWMAETTRSVRAVPLPSNTHGLEPEVQVGSQSILFDDDGSLWITSAGDGMRRVPFPDQMNGQKIGEFGPEAESFTEKDGLSNDLSTRILKDREGSIWVVTVAGLDRFRRSALVPVMLPGKLGVRGTFPEDGGNIWVSSLGGGQAWTDGHTWHYLDHRYYFPHGVRESGGVTWLVNFLPGPRTIVRKENEKLTVVAQVPPESQNLGQVLAEDRDGTLWIAGGPHQIFFWKDGKWGELETPPEIAGQVAYSAFTDDGGRMWFGFNNTIMALDGRKVRTFTDKDGVSLGAVTAFTSLSGHLWFGGTRGLQVLDGDHFRNVDPAEGDRFSGVTGIEQDAGGDLFVSELRGIVFIPAAEVAKIVRNGAAKVQDRIFDERDGWAGASTRWGPYPTSVQGTDGRLWFSSLGGVAWIDPAHILKNQLLPPVVIRSITANETRYASSAGLKLPPQTRRLLIDYTALSLAVPERVRFRYKLEGSDKDWQDAGTRREATYTNLNPGPYRFQVLACNNDGVWNETGASLEFSILPAWYQTIWFRSSCVGVFLVLLWMLYQFRLEQLERQYSIRTEERVSERTRIARELHDTLLQSLHGLMFEFQAARNMLPGKPEAAMRVLDDTLAGTEQAITESQEAIEDLRGEAVADNDIAQRLRAMGEELMAVRSADHALPDHGSPGHASPSFGLTLEGEQRDLAPLIREQVYRIAREIVRNAFRHAQAHRIEAEILFDNHQFRLRVRDDGKGMARDILQKGGRAGHWGLRGVRERAQKMGAKLDIWSEVGAGTEVQLAVPASVAYEKTPDRSSFRLSRFGLSRFRLFRGTQNHDD